MDKSDFEDTYFTEISSLAENLYKVYCETVYDPYNLDYPELGYLPIDVGNLFWESAITLLMQEEDYWEEE